MIRVAVGILTSNGVLSPNAITPTVLDGHDLRHVLLCQRSKHSRYGLKWEFPGGKVEAGETASDCLRRELREELDIDASIGELYHRQNYVYPDSGTFDVHYYIVPSFSGQIVNRVFESLSWVPVKDLQNFDILEGNADVVEKLMKNYDPADPRQS